MVLACLIPVVLGSLFWTQTAYTDRRAALESHMLDTSRALGLAIDRELIGIQSTLRVLALSPRLQDGNLAAFYTEAKGVQPLYPEADIILADPTGQQLINTYLPWGAPLPRRNVGEPLRTLYETGKPVISNLFQDAVTKRPLISLDMPVFRDGKVVYDLAITLSADRFTDMLKQERLPPDWIGTVADTTHVIVARTRDADKYVGQHTIASSATISADSSDGTVRLVLFEGDPATGAFTRSAMSGWSVGIIVPTRVLTSQIWSWISLQLTSLTALLIVCGITARQIALRIARSVRALVAPAMALGQGGAVAVVPLEIAEADEVAQALCQAANLLERRSQERDNAEHRLREAQKMQVVGQLTGGIAHDFNNLLTVVLGSLQLLRKRLPPGDERAERLLDNAVGGAERGAALTQRLLAFGRRQTLRPEPVDLPTLVRGMSGLLHSSVGGGVQVETHFPIVLAPALVDANQLELAVLNLAANARDAMAGNGRLVIAAREEPAGAEGAFVVLSITDTGEGMDEATLARASEPFFTTKGIGKGTGLGLSMVHGLAVQSGGKLVLHSVPGQGTSAELWLPRAEATDLPPTPPVSAVAVPRSEPGRRRTVLVVDDDPLVLASTAALLEDLGHTTMKAASGRQALEILRTGAQVDLVVTDQSMPGMTGVQLAAELRRLQPDLPLLLATGYAERAEVVASGLPLLAKPFDQAALAVAIGERLKESANDREVVAI